MGELSWLDENNTEFPPSNHALTDPNGLLAVGGDLSPARLVSAYSRGIFPWFSDGQPILWWTPSPRMILRPEQLHIGRSLKKLAKKAPFIIKVDSAFESVIRHCASVPRDEQDGTWITEEMINAYVELHQLGIAHSVEAWQDDELVGGLYGIALGKAFFGESMFSLVSGASKIAFATLATQLHQWSYLLIDCQIHTDYLSSFGANEVPRKEFETLLKMGVPSNIELSQFTPTNWKETWEMPESGIV